MRSSGLIYPYYLSTWREVLIGWLGWHEERLAAWVEGWEGRIRGNVHGWADSFYHEDELHYVLPLLVPEAVASRLAGQRTKRIYNDLAHLLYEELAPAIAGRPRVPSWGTPDFDWMAAKRRVESVLRSYGTGLPSPEEITAYERQVRGTGTDRRRSPEAPGQPSPE